VADEADVDEAVDGDGRPQAELTGRAVRDAPPHASDAPYPLVIVSHGYPGNRFLLSHLSENLASKGYVVAAIDHTDSTYAHQKRAGAVLEARLDAAPRHPGLFHYLIHAYDNPVLAENAVDVARAYDKLAPDVPHALHMPSHIFVRLGEWDEVVRWNLRASEAALAQRVGPSNEFVWDEYPHAVEYLAYAHLQQGRDEEAERVIRESHRRSDLQPGFKTAFHLSSIPARYALERGEWQEAAELVPRTYDALEWDHFPWPEAVTWFAKGLGAAHSDRNEDAQLAHERLQALEEIADKAGEKLFARRIRVLKLTVSA
jgi:hypothetical protein